MKRRPSVECRQQPDTFQQLTGCDIVKRGALYLKHPPSILPAAFSIQPWKKRYVVLRDTWYCSPRVVTSLDIYDSEPVQLATGNVDCQSGSARRTDPYSIDLRQLTAVGFHLESRRFQFAFYVERCDARPLLFAADSDLEMRCWVAALRMLADKARVSVKTSPNCTRFMPCSSSDRRCTLPDVDVTVSLPLNRRRRNLSEPQLHAVPTVAAAAAAAAGRRCVGSSVSSSSGAQCKMTSTDGSRTRLSPLSAVLSLDEVDVESLPSHSLDGAAVAAANGANVGEHLPLRRMFSTSVLGSLLRKDVGGGTRWKPFGKDRRKDSGFSDSFDEATYDQEVVTATGVDGEQDSPPGCTVSPPPTPPAPPPRPPPRRATVADDRSTSPPHTRHPPPPLPSERRSQVDKADTVPPTPPPRPLHTLQSSAVWTF